MIVNNLKGWSCCDPREQIFRRFHFKRKDEVERTFFVNASQFEENNWFNLSKIFHYLAQKGLIIEGYNFLLSQNNLLIDPNFPCWITEEYFSQKDLTFQRVDKHFSLDQLILETKVLNTQIYIDTLNSIQNVKLQNNNSMEEEIFKRVKQPERKIGEVIQSVKYWRLLHQIDNFSLGDAARIVGISKKSLDDYYLLLRNGQYSKFDFENNLCNGIGKLRSYIRKHGSRSQGRLPKAINQYKLFNLIQQPQKILQIQIQDSLYNYKIDQSQ